MTDATFPALEHLFFFIVHSARYVVLLLSCLTRASSKRVMSRGREGDWAIAMWGWTGKGVMMLKSGLVGLSCVQLLDILYTHSYNHWKLFCSAIYIVSRGGQPHPKYKTTQPANYDNQKMFVDLHCMACLYCN